jgi:hypothetical protein
MHKEMLAAIAFHAVRISASAKKCKEIVLKLKHTR